MSISRERNNKISLFVIVRCRLIYKMADKEAGGGGRRSVGRFTPQSAVNPNEFEDVVKQKFAGRIN